MKPQPATTVERTRSGVMCGVNPRFTAACMAHCTSASSSRAAPFLKYRNFWPLTLPPDSKSNMSSPAPICKWSFRAKPAFSDDLGVPLMRTTVACSSSPIGVSGCDIFGITAARPSIFACRSSTSASSLLRSSLICLPCAINFSLSSCSILPFSSFECEFRAFWTSCIWCRKPRNSSYIRTTSPTSHGNFRLSALACTASAFSAQYA
mmetsp:Transcript_104349/g.319451  ORF Transcript_104349/g.319451 Transcript_104349/m.319451 type:complete len:207 (-) Transcript_104349:32-652(-)